MSFLSSNNGEVISAKITKNGRKAIASGSFNVAYFQIGDSEFDYSNGFINLVNASLHQSVLSPFDKDSAIKYPLSLDSNTTTTFGIPVLNPNYNTTNLRNVMGPAGHVSNFASGSVSGTTVSGYYELKSLTGVTGGTTLNVISGSQFNINDYLTLTFSSLSGSTNIITGNTNSLVYKVTNVSGNQLTLDRNLPDLSTFTKGTIINNNFDTEIDTTNPDPTCLPLPLTSTNQLNSWTLNNIWTTKPIGADVNGLNEDISGYTSNTFVSAKNFLGYTKTSGQTFQNLTGGTVGYSSTSIGTSFVDCKGNVIEVSPEEQRVISVIHYSELGDIIYEPERFYKYDDFISHLTGTTYTVAPSDQNGNPVSDAQYFEVYLPFVYYHRSPNKADSKGARFFMDTVDYYMKSTTGITESNINIKYRYLIDENNNRVGKVFVNHKVIVFDDQELVAILDYRSNRKYTLSAPKLTLLPTGDNTNALLTGVTQTLWVTYAMRNGVGSSLNVLPCNYQTKITGTTGLSNVTVNFNLNELQFLKSQLSDLPNGYLTKELFLLVQMTTGTTLPSSSSWRYINTTTDLGYNGTTYITANSIANHTFIIDYNAYNNAASNIFDLDNHMSGVTSNYLGNAGNPTNPQFGDIQPFPGSVRLVRGSDIEEFNFLVNLPIGKFSASQNPTYTTGQDVYFTEIALLDSNKKALVSAKTPTPIKRIGAQVVSVRLDF